MTCACKHCFDGSPQPRLSAGAATSDGEDEVRQPAARLRPVRVVPLAAVRGAFRLLFAGLAFALCAGPAGAHKASDAYVQLTGTDAGTSLRVDVALRDLDAALDLDADADGRLTWGELRSAWPTIQAYVQPRVQVAGCEFRPAAPGLERRGDGVYAALNATADCALGADPAVRYTLMAEVDPTHRGIARIDVAGQPSQARVLDPTNPDSLAGPAPRFVVEGIRHIVGGFDHVLFLLCLLLPSAMRRTSEGWRPVTFLRHAVLPVAGIVTAFTLAHSITLALAALKLVSLPPAFIEPAIAVTIMLAAIDNLYPLFRGRRVAVTFLFGLIHGFGFAGVLAELHLPTSQFVSALLQFNVGLELGQMIIIAAAAAPLFLLRSRPRYPAWGIQGGSLAALLVGLLWFVERSGAVY